MSDERERELLELAREIEARRVLAPGGGESPRIELASVLAGVPKPRPRWPLALAASVLVVFAIQLVPTQREKGAPSCEVVLDLADLEQGEPAPLASRTVTVGTEVAVLATSRAPCSVSVHRVDPARREVELWSGPERFTGQKRVVERRSLARVGQQIIVALAAPEPVALERDALFELLRAVGEGRPCLLAGRPCAVDALELEVK